MGRLRYDGKVNGYRPGRCITGYPRTFQGATPDQGRCDYPDVTNQNGFYYLGILDYATPAPHGNPGIHNHRKVVMDGYNSVAPWSGKYGVCNPATKKVESVKRGNLNDVNAVFIRGDKFRAANNNVSNEYYFKTACGSFSGDSTWGPAGGCTTCCPPPSSSPRSCPRRPTLSRSSETAGTPWRCPDPFSMPAT